MTQTIEVNIVDVLNRLENKVDNLSSQVDTKINRLENKIDDLSNQLQTEVNRLENKVDKLSEDTNDIKTSVAKLEENQNGLNKRLENVEFINRSIFASILVGIVLTVVAGITKLLFPNLIG